MTICPRCGVHSAFEFDCVCGQRHALCAVCFRLCKELRMVEKEMSLIHAKFRVCPTPEAITAHRLMEAR